MAIEITDKAADAIRKQAAKRTPAPLGLRVGIRGGGCTGFAYLFEWADTEPRPEDLVFEKDGVRVFVDPKSHKFLDGTRLDYFTGLMGHGFKFENPQVKGQCGCGESVQF